MQSQQINDLLALHFSPREPAFKQKSPAEGMVSAGPIFLQMNL